MSDSYLEMLSILLVSVDFFPVKRLFQKMDCIVNSDILPTRNPQTHPSLLFRGNKG